MVMMDRRMLIVLPLVFLATLYLTTVVFVEAYDVTPTVDSPREFTQQDPRGGEVTTEVYRFGEARDKLVQYSDGTIVPSRTFSIERLVNQTTGEYEVIGYANVHGHKVKTDETDVIDISIGTTVRINPKY